MNRAPGEPRARHLARSFAKDVSGATAIEYGLMAGLLSISIVAAMSAVGAEVNALFRSVVAMFPKN
jgi:pilus assembly protein Flp/PilA